MDARLFDVQHNLYNKQKTEFVEAHYHQYFKITTPHSYVRNCIAFNVVKHLTPIGSIKSFTKFNCNLCMVKRIKILKHSTNHFPSIFPKH